MKNILIVFGLLISFISNAQINKTISVDKFDGIVLEIEEKTLITHSDSTILFEVVGKDSEIYRKIMNESFETKTVPTNLINNVYGFEEIWYVIPEISYDAFITECVRAYNESQNDSEYKHKLQKLISRYYVIITHQTVIDQYTRECLDDLM